MTLSTAAWWTTILFFLSETLVGWENFKLLRSSWFLNSNGLSDLFIQADRFPKILIIFFKLMLARPRMLELILVVRQALLILLLISSNWIWIFLFILVELVWLVLFRGNFNGGSDFMRVIAATALLISRLGLEPKWQHVGMWYLALQSVSSYFVAGWVKVKSASWRNGSAIVGFLRSSLIGSSNIFASKLNSNVATVGTCGFLLLECTFPLVWLSSRLALYYVCMALAFHVANFILFGLNRFVWIWVVTYPAILYTSLNGLQL